MTASTQVVTPPLDVACPEAREHLLNDVLADRVGERSFQPSADLDANLVVLHEDEEDHPIVDAFLADTPSAKHPQAVIVERSCRLHPGKDYDDKLVGRFMLEALQPAVQVDGEIWAGGFRVVAEPMRWHGCNDLCRCGRRSGNRRAGRRW